MIQGAGATFILHRDPRWLVVNKPCGMATHAASPGELGVVEWLDLHLGIRAQVVSRLDRETSGALLLALDGAASAEAQAIHERGAARKVYEFLAGADSRDAGLPDAWTRDDPLDSKAAATRFFRLGPASRCAGSGAAPPIRYRAEITRGRKHQIRRHAAASGVPLLGDPEYGGDPFPRLCLHCLQVEWPGITAPVAAPLPPALRLLAEGGAGSLDLALCRDRRGVWLASVTDAHRIVHRDEIPGLPVSIEIFGSWLNAVWYDEAQPLAEARSRLGPLLDEVCAIWAVRGGVLRAHSHNPHAEGLAAERLVIGDPPPPVIQVAEHGLAFRIDLLKTQHTGLFLDQRDTRRRLALAAAGKRVANLFAFTCSFSVMAAAERAEVVFSVDTARPCLNTGKANFKLNGLEETGIGKFVQEDARKWLKRQRRRKAELGGAFPAYDLVVCDPPVFASSRDGGKFSLEDEWPLLAAAVAAILAPSGTAYFANNHRGGDHSAYRRALEACFGEVIDLRPPLDFPVRTGHPHHVRTFAVRNPRPV